MSEHKRYQLEEPLVEQSSGAELWSAQSRNGSGKKWRRKSREMVMFTRAHPSQPTWSTKRNPTLSGKAAWVEETHLAKTCLSHPTFCGKVPRLFACPVSILAHLPDLGVNWLLGPPQHSSRHAPCSAACLGFYKIPAYPGSTRFSWRSALQHAQSLGSNSDRLPKKQLGIPRRLHHSEQSEQSSTPPSSWRIPREKKQPFQLGCQVRSRQRSAQHFGFYMLCLEGLNTSGPHAHTSHKG